MSFSKTRYIREHLEALGIDPLIVSKYKKAVKEDKRLKKFKAMWEEFKNEGLSR